MAGPKAKSASATGPIKKSKSAPSTNGTSSPVPPPAAATPDGSETVHNYGPGKPDKSIYDAEQEKVKVEIEALQVKLNAVRDKIALTGRGGAGNERRSELRAQLDAIRGQQSAGKQARGKIFDQLKTIQDGVQKKVKDLNAARGKIPYRTVEEVDERIKHLEKQVESGNLKLVDEKRALQEISQCRRNRRVVEGFQAEQESIEAERAKADALRSQLDDPEAKAISEQYDAINEELKQINKEGEEAYNNKTKLLDERTALQQQLDVLWGEKKASNQAFRDANDRFYAKLNEDRARRAERARAQRAAEEAEKKKEIIERLREEASIPAYQVQIEDCQTLIDHFLGKASAPALSRTTSERSELVGVPKLDLRQVAPPTDGGLVARKRKGEDEEAYFVGGGGKKKGGKRGNKPQASALTPEPLTPDSPNPSSQLHVPLPILSALLALSIPPPTSSSEVPRVVDDLRTKKAWFEANQDRATAEQKDKAEHEISRLTGKIEQLQVQASSSSSGDGAGGKDSPVPVTQTEESETQVEGTKDAEAVAV